MAGQTVTEETQVETTQAAANSEVTPEAERRVEAEISLDTDGDLNDLATPTSEIVDQAAEHQRIADYLEENPNPHSADPEVARHTQMIRLGHTVVRNHDGSTASDAMQHDLQAILGNDRAVLSSTDIEAMQVSLNQMGYQIAVDGAWGPETQRAVDLAMGRDEELPTISVAQYREEGLELPEAYLLSQGEHEDAVALARAGFSGGYYDLATAQEAFALAMGDDNAIGFVSERFESGGRGPGTIGRNAGDFGGASYGTHQLSANAGSLQRFLAVSGYGDQLPHYRSAGFDAAWRNLAATDPEFGRAQHAYITTSHYEPQAARLRAAGFDLEGIGQAGREAVFSTATQYGPNTSIIERAFSSLSPQQRASLTPMQFVEGLQRYKAANVNSHFRSSSGNIRASVANRIPQELAMLQELARQDMTGAG